MRWEVRGSIKSGKHVKTIVEAPTEPEARKLANTKFSSIDSVIPHPAAALPQPPPALQVAPTQQPSPAPQAGSQEPPPPTQPVAAELAPPPAVRPRRDPMTVLVGLVLAMQVISLITYCIVEKGKRVNASRVRLLTAKLASDRASSDLWQDRLADAKASQSRRLSTDTEIVGVVADAQKTVDFEKAVIAEDLKEIESAERAILP